MAFWPWKSRPTIAPFREDYTGELLHIPDQANVTTFVFQLPGDVYLVPSVISLRIITGAGIRSSTPSSLLISRGGHIYNGCNFGPVASSQTAIIFLSACTGTQVSGTVRIGRLYAFPWPSYCYPDDIFTFDIPSLILGDVIEHIHIHGKLWRTN
jgi:hypothetical protein